MNLIPFQVDNESYNLFVILEDRNIERMKGYDPAQFDTRRLPPEWQRLRLNVVIIGYATDADLVRVRELIATGSPLDEALHYLSRGFVYLPQEGDNDFNYTKPQ